MKETENVFGSKNSQKSILAEAKKLINENKALFNLENGYLEEEEIDEIEQRIRICFDTFQEKYSQKQCWDALKNGTFDQVALNKILDNLLSNYSKYSENVKSYNKNAWGSNIGWSVESKKDRWTNFSDVQELNQHFKTVLKKGNDENFIEQCQEYGVFSILDLNLIEIYFKSTSDDRKLILEKFLSKSDRTYFNIFKTQQYTDTYELATDNIIELNEQLAECRRKQLQKSSNIIKSLEKLIERETISPFAKWKLNVAMLSHANSTPIGRYRAYLSYYKDNKINVEVKKEFDSQPNYDGYLFVLNIIDKEYLTTSWFGNNKMIQRNRKYISKDVQKVDIQNETRLLVHMHKHFDPEVILVENYEEALELEDMITSSRIKERRDFIKRN